MSCSTSAVASGGGHDFTDYLPPPLTQIYFERGMFALKWEQLSTAYITPCEIKYLFVCSLNEEQHSPRTRAPLLAPEPEI